MRVVMLSDRIPPEHVGGAEKVAWLLAAGLYRAGHEVHVIAATAGASFHEQREGIATHHLHARYSERYQAWLSLYNPQTVGPLRQLLTDIQPDVLHAHNIHHELSYASLPLARTLGIPVVFTSHDAMPFAYTKYDHFIDPSRCEVETYRLPPLFNVRQMRLRYNPLRNWLIRIWLRRCTQIRTCVSVALQSAFEANSLPPFRVVYNGLDPAGFDVAPQRVEELRQRFHLAGRQVILFAGRLSRAKGSEQLLLALDQVVKQMPQAIVLALSAKKWQPTSRFQALCDHHVMKGGWLAGEDLAAAYHLAQVITVPSIYLDPSPTVNFEAMAAANAVIASCYGGSAEVVVDGQTGYIINPFDTQIFAERLMLLLRDPDLRRRIGEAGRQRLLDQFALDKQVRSFLALYEEARTFVATKAFG